MMLMQSGCHPPDDDLSRSEVAGRQVLLHLKVGVSAHVDELDVVGVVDQSHCDTAKHVREQEHCRRKSSQRVSRMRKEMGVGTARQPRARKL